MSATASDVRRDRPRVIGRPQPADQSRELGVGQAVAKAKSVTRVPWIAHLMRAQLRFSSRMGNQSAGAISYFSILAIVPLLMFAFSLLGMTLTIVRPDWLEWVKGEVAGYIDRNVQVGGNLNQQINGLIDSYLSNWRGLGVVGLVSLAYAGSAWLGNMRKAIRAQWRPELENEVDKRNFVITLVTNLWMLLVLLVAIGLTFTIGTFGTALSTRIAHWIRLEELTVGRLTMKLVAVLLSVVAAWALFLLIYWMLPRQRAQTRSLIIGSLVAALLLAALQLGAGALFGVFSGNKGVALFGPIIVLMLLFNLFGRLVLWVAAWIATTTQPAVAYQYNVVDEPLRDDPRAETAPGHWRRADRQRLKELAQDRGLSFTAVPATTEPLFRDQTPTRIDLLRPDPNRTVPHDLAVRTVRAGTATGYVVGAATGLGLGAVVTRLVTRLFRH